MSEARPSVGRREHGFAMVMSIILIAVMGTLAALVLFNGSHADRGSGRGDNWNSSLHTAEAGVQDAITRIQVANGAPPAPFSGTTRDGTYEVAVQYLGRNRYQIDAVGHTGVTESLRAERGIRVMLGPPPVFTYALFSLADVDTKNNNLVLGDIWANGSVLVESGDTVDGNVNAATGHVRIRNGSLVTGEIWSGGNDTSGQAVVVENNATVDGDVKASSTHHDCEGVVGQTTKYKVAVGGRVTGTVTTWGTKTGSGPVGELQAGVCTAAPATKAMPQFRYNPLNYDPAPTHHDSVAAFQSWLGPNAATFSGVHFVYGPGAIDVSSVTVVGDASIMAMPSVDGDWSTAASINADGLSANDVDKVLVLASFYGPPEGNACTGGGGNPDKLGCAIGFRNNFSPGQTATLLYAPHGPVSLKNNSNATSCPDNADFIGAVYAADLVLKNNTAVCYDERVEQIAGFGEVTLVQRSWVELPVEELTVG